jgi:pilus assembly protein CpaB
MRTGSLVLVIGAAACAAGAALLTKTWLAANTAQPVVKVVERSTPVQTEMRTVVVATRPLPFGTRLSAAALDERHWPAVSVPKGVFTSKADLLKEERTVLSAIIQDEPILASKVTAPGQRASLSFIIEKGKKAVTIRVDDVLGVAGFVQPDDRVDILLTRKVRGDDKKTSAYTDVLLQDIRVLAIDQAADRDAKQTKPAKTVTVEVLTADAQKLVLAASLGQLSLALRHAGWSLMAKPRRIGEQDLFGPSGSAPVGNNNPVVTVTRATNRERYEVLEGSEQPDGVELPTKAEPIEESADGDQQQASAEPRSQHRFFGPSDNAGELGADGEDTIVSPVPVGPQ